MSIFLHNQQYQAFKYLILRISRGFLRFGLSGIYLRKNLPKLDAAADALFMAEAPAFDTKSSAI
jgi:hypothetical protein